VKKRKKKQRTESPVLRMFGNCDDATKAPYSCTGRCSSTCDSLFYCLFQSLFASSATFRFQCMNSHLLGLTISARCDIHCTGRTQHPKFHTTQSPISHPQPQSHKYLSLFVTAMVLKRFENSTRHSRHAEVTVLFTADLNEFLNLQ